MRYDVEKQKEIFRKNPDIEVIYFWGHTPNPKKMTTACFSQWYNCMFEVDGHTYHTAEQYMMAEKARLFDDPDTLAEILAADNPADYKKLGRKVKNFDFEKWNDAKYNIVVKGNMAKFGQHPELKEFLLSTGDALIAEASPYDKIWGIGLNRETAVKGTPEQWVGENLLGCALMEVRDNFRQ